jgi:hypothetical protein
MADRLTTYERGVQDFYDAWLKDIERGIAPIAEAIAEVLQPCGGIRHNNDGTFSLLPRITREDIATVLDILVTIEDERIKELQGLADAQQDAFHEAVRQGVI